LVKIAWKCLAQPARHRLGTKTPSSDPISIAEIVVATALWRIVDCVAFFQQCGFDDKQINFNTVNRSNQKAKQDLKRISTFTEESCEIYLKSKNCLNYQKVTVMRSTLMKNFQSLCRYGGTKKRY
jgi:hypothetical protein